MNSTSKTPANPTTTCPQPAQNQEESQIKNIYELNPETDCFIGGLPITSSEEEIQTFLQKQLPKLQILCVKLILNKRNKKFNKGFGFVFLKTEKDATRLLNSENLIFKQKKLDIRQAAKFNTERKNRDNFFNKRLYFKGLCIKTTEKELNEFLTREFKVVRSYIIKNFETGNSKGVAFADFLNESEARLCLAKKKIELGNKIVKIELFKSKEVLKKEQLNLSQTKTRAKGSRPLRQGQNFEGQAVRAPRFSFCDSESSNKKVKEWLFASQQKKLNEAAMNYRMRKILALEKKNLQNGSFQLKSSITIRRQPGNFFNLL